METVETIKNGANKALILRACNADMSSHGGFVWPRSGPVEAPDWRPTAECGYGLHGALWGEGDGSFLSWALDAVWIVAEIEEWIDLDGKVKFPRAEVLFVGSRVDATAFLAARAPGRAIIGGTASAGCRGTASAGYGGTASAGDGGIASAGDGGILQIRWYSVSRYRIAVGYVGEDGIEANVLYRVSGGKLVRA